MIPTAIKESPAKSWIGKRTRRYRSLLILPFSCDLLGIHPSSSSQVFQLVTLLFLFVPKTSSFAPEIPLLCGPGRSHDAYFHRSPSQLGPSAPPDLSANTMNESEEDMLKSNRSNKQMDWFIWMMQGSKPRGTSKVILREAEELGGVPREDRYSSADWIHNTLSLPNSAILRSIRSPVIAVTTWATFLSIVHRHLIQTNELAIVTNLYIPGTPHSLMMSALGLLLVFRTNSAYQRFAEGRVIWERIVNIARDLSRMTMLYDQEIGVDKRRRIQRLLVAFPYLLRHRIRPNLVMRRLDDDEYKRDPENTILLYQDTGIKDNDPEAANVAQEEEATGMSRRKKRKLYWVDKRTLPWRLLPSTDALEKCARAQNRPLWVCDRMAAEIRHTPDTAFFSARERLALLKHVDDLSKCIGGAERIHQTTVPLNYARHTLRALTLWLFSLPFCLIKDLGLVTGPMLFFVSWLLFGVYEIGYAIEDPFQGTLRLSILCDTIRRDVMGDETTRNSAFQLDCTLKRSYGNEDETALNGIQNRSGQLDEDAMVAAIQRSDTAYQ